MSAPQPAAALKIWRARRSHSVGDRAYVLYAFALAALVALVPLVRALWLLATAPAGIALLTSTGTIASVSILTAGFWAGALLLGRIRGPALMPPFPMLALTSSGIRRSSALRRPLVIAAVTITAAFACTAAFVSAVLVSSGRAQPLEPVGFVAASIAVGIITTLMWLMGQVFPRASVPLALGVMAAAAFTGSSPQLLAATPWGWAGSTYPLQDYPVGPSIGLALLVLVLLLAAPLLLNTLTGMQLGVQAARWERATMFSFSFDFGGAGVVYATEPRLGRHLRAVKPFRPRALTFLMRDTIGQLRTPVRFLIAVSGLVAAGIAVTVSFLFAEPLLPLTAVAALIALTASGALAQGVRHAARVAGDHPLYGISDVALVCVHSLFPLAAVTVVLPTTATVTALATGAPLLISLVGAWALGLLILAVQLNSALKGPLPPGLLTPVSTPAGDLSILLQLGWALSDVVIATCAGLAVAVLEYTPLPLLLASAAVGGITVVRWRRRR